MGAHFWGQVGATFTVVVLVLNLFSDRLTVFGMRAIIRDEQVPFNAYVQLAAILVGGVALVVVIWS